MRRLYDGLLTQRIAHLFIFTFFKERRFPRPVYGRSTNQVRYKAAVIWLCVGCTDVELMPCHSDPCNNGATCVMTSPTEFRCVCNDNYTGTYCDTGINTHTDFNLQPVNKLVSDSAGNKQTPALITDEQNMPRITQCDVTQSHVLHTPGIILYPSFLTCTKPQNGVHISLMQCLSPAGNRITGHQLTLCYNVYCGSPEQKMYPKA